MIKKIFVSVLLAGAFGLLIMGAVNRTMAKSTNSEPLALTEGSLRGNGTEAGYQKEEKTNQINNDLNRGSARSDFVKGNNSQISRTGSGYGGGQNNNTAGEYLGNGLADVQNWEDPITVRVESSSPDLWIVSNNKGFYLEIEGRALRYMIENGFEVSYGDELLLIGFYENENYEIGSITNITTQQSLAVRSEIGRPLWAGGGRGSKTMP